MSHGIRQKHQLEGTPRLNPLISGSCKGHGDQRDDDDRCWCLLDVRKQVSNSDSHCKKDAVSRQVIAVFELQFKGQYRGFKSMACKEKYDAETQPSCGIIANCYWYQNQYCPSKNREQRGEWADEI